MPVGFSSALKRNWKGIDKKELELELIKRNRMAWEWAETLVEIRGTLADIRGTTK